MQIYFICFDDKPWLKSMLERYKVWVKDFRGRQEEINQLVTRTLNWPYCVDANHLHTDKVFMNGQWNSCWCGWRSQYIIKKLPNYSWLEGQSFE